MHTRSRELAAWLRTRTTAAGADGLVVGLSGSVESGVVARLCQLAMPDRSVAVISPSPDDSPDDAAARLIARHFDLRIVTIDLAAGAVRLASDLHIALQGPPGTHLGAPGGGLGTGAPLARIQPRLRMAALYFLADSWNYLVVGSTSRSELTIGAFTQHGDSGVDLLPLGNVLRSEVLALARDLDVPEEATGATAAPVWSGQSGEGRVGFTHADLERYLGDGPDAVAPATALKIERLMRTSEPRRAFPLMPPEE